VSDNAKLADDLLHGIREIADYVGESYRSAQWNIERGRYPVTRIGKIVTARKSALNKIYTPEPTAQRPRKPEAEQAA